MTCNCRTFLRGLNYGIRLFKDIINRIKFPKLHTAEKELLIDEFKSEQPVSTVKIESDPVFKK